MLTNNFRNNSSYNSQSFFQGPPNCFEQTMLGLEFASADEKRADLFSRTCIEQYQNSSSDEFNYHFAQVFEPHVLKEICMLRKIDFESVENLTVQPSTSIKKLFDLINDRKNLTVIHLLNIAATLISISRFSAAKLALLEAKRRPNRSCDRFEIALLEFVISNRADNGQYSEAAFTAMRKEIEGGQILPDRTLDSCIQAVVWYLKTKEISEDNYTWFYEKGLSLAKNTSSFRTQDAISSWYRAIAMIPAAEGNVQQTREFMLIALESAEQAFSSAPSVHKMHLKKTYFESTLKEHLYVTKNREKAEQAGNDLIELDPNWSASYGELAEVHQKFGDWNQAALTYEKAALLGPPYLGHHLFASAQCFEKAGNTDQALAYFHLLSQFDPKNKSVVLAGLKCARKHQDQTLSHFEERFVDLQTTMHPKEIQWLNSL